MCWIDTWSINFNDIYSKALSKFNGKKSGGGDGGGRGRHQTNIYSDGGEIATTPTHFKPLLTYEECIEWISEVHIIHTLIYVCARKKNGFGTLVLW